MNDSSEASDDGIGAILFYGGRLYRLGYARGLATNRNLGVDSDELFEIALEVALMAKFYASEYLERVAAGSESLQREAEKDIERIDQVQKLLADRVTPFE